MNQTIRDKILNIGNELKTLYVERDQVTDGCICSILAGQHILLLGQPGIAKSALINELCLRLEGAEWFSWLLTKFSTPEEIFGPISLKGLENDKFCRIIDNKLPRAHIAFLDEIFKANSAILNSLLTIINERKYHNDGSPQIVPLISVFGASNELPQNSNELGALYDRFLIRFNLQPIQEDSAFIRMLTNANITPVQKTTISLEELAKAQEEVKTVAIPESVLITLVKIRKELQIKGLYNSDRRYKQLLSILQANAWLEGRDFVNDDDLEILENCLWSDPKEKTIVSEVVISLASPFKAQIREFSEMAEEVFDQYEKVKAEKGKDAPETSSAGTDSSIKLKKIINNMKGLEEQAKAENKDLTSVNEVMKKIKKMQEKIFSEMTGL